MRRLLLSFIFLLAAATAFAQKLEITAGAYSGLFSYGGKSASSFSFINSSSSSNFSASYTNNPYGSKMGFGYGISAQAQLVAKGGFIVGLQAAYEQLRSKTDITQVYTIDNSLPGIAPNFVTLDANGSTALKNNIINLNPYVGYRIPFPKVKLDALVGTDVAFITGTREKGSAKASNGNTYTTDLDRSTIKTDLRLRFGLAATVNRLSFNASYALGVRNSMEGYIGGSPETHSRVIRIGLGYRIF